MIASLVSGFLGSLGSGCGEAGEEEADTDGGREGALLLGEVDAEGACNTAGVIESRIRAFRVGCEQGPPAPCTLPSEPEAIEGDRSSCPTSDQEVLLGVDITQPGRYRVEEVWIDPVVDERVFCFAEDGQTEILVTTQDVEEGRSRVLTRTSGPC